MITHRHCKSTRLNYWKTKKVHSKGKKEEIKKTEEYFPIVGPKKKLLQKYQNIPTTETFIGHQKHLINMKVHTMRNTKQ